MTTHTELVTEADSGRCECGQCRARIGRQAAARKIHNDFMEILAREMGDTFEPDAFRCSWLVQVPSGNPEPDSIEDTYRIVECGAWAKPVGAGFECEAGHAHRGIEIEWAEDAQREQEERMATGW